MLPSLKFLFIDFDISSNFEKQIKPTIHTKYFIALWASKTSLCIWIIHHTVTLLVHLFHTMRQNRGYVRYLKTGCYNIWTNTTSQDMSYYIESSVQDCSLAIYCCVLMIPYENPFRSYFTLTNETVVWYRFSILNKPLIKLPKYISPQS